MTYLNGHLRGITQGRYTSVCGAHGEVISLQYGDVQRLCQADDPEVGIHGKYTTDVASKRKSVK